MLGQLLDRLSGQWAIHLGSRVPRTELYEARIASSKPSLGFFILLISSAVIATLGLVSNSTAVVIGAMIVSPLMDPILSLALVWRSVTGDPTICGTCVGVMAVVELHLY